MMSLFQVGYLLLDHVYDSISCNTLLFSDIIIDCENSTGFIESGKGHKIMKCVMKKALSLTRRSDSTGIDQMDNCNPEERSISRTVD